MAVAATRKFENRESFHGIEHGEPVSEDDSAHVRERTLDELEDGLPLLPPEYPREAGTRYPGLPTSGPAWIPPSSVDKHVPPRSDRGASLLIGFLMLTVAGGAAAAIFLHERVADILTLLLP